MKVSWVVAVSENGVIGKDGALPWRLADDMKLFRTITTGGCVLMGRKTYEGIGRPLPNRTNLVLSGSPNLQIPGCHVFGSVEDVLAFAEKSAISEVMVIGGERLFVETECLVNKVYLTTVHTTVQGDTFFHYANTLKGMDWQPKGPAIRFEADDRNQFAFDHCVYVKKTNERH
jgi:dihydrofolate reductase